MRQAILKNSDFDVSKADALTECSLYQAVRWVAYGEKPLAQFVAESAYPYFNCDDWSDTVEVKLQDLENGDFDFAFIPFVEKFNAAAIVLHAALINGNIQARGDSFIDPNNFADVLIRYEKRIPIKKLNGEEKVSIEKSAWVDNWKDLILKSDYSDGLKQKAMWENCSLFSISWRDGELKHANLERKHYANIILDFVSLKAVFPRECAVYPERSKPERHESRGRKPKYDWEAFYVAMILKALHPDGLPEIQADLERDMAQWCIENDWLDEPQESQIRAKISPIYQGVRKAKK